MSLAGARMSLARFVNRGIDKYLGPFSFRFLPKSFSEKKRRVVGFSMVLLTIFFIIIVILILGLIPLYLPSSCKYFKIKNVQVKLMIFLSS